MKSNFWKKLAVFLGLAVGAVTMTACQSTSTTDGSIKFERKSLSMYYDETGSKKFAVITSYIQNNTIYDIQTWNIEVVPYVGQVAQDPVKNENVDFYVTHGSYGTVTVSYEIPKTITDIQLKKAEPNKILSAWETYLGWWICGIVLVALSWIFFTAEILGKKLTSDQIMELFKANAGGTICVGLFIFILCMFPLFFGAWVPTVILVISLACGILGCGAIGGIAAAISHKKAK